jgi:signal transduction histidine kinase
MPDHISCPRCNHPVDPHAHHCSNCGVNLALAAALAERTLTEPLKVPTGALVSPEVLVPRLGEYLIEKELVSREDLQLGLQYQRKKLEAGESCLIGQALIELGIINRSNLDKAVTEQILQLQRALKTANLELEDRVQTRTADLQRALSKLTELNQLKTNFISNISHELRTPLTHIKGYLDMLIDASFGPLSVEQINAIQVIKRSEARLEKLIEDLIQFSLAARGELSLNLGNFSLSKVIDLTISQLSRKAQNSHITIRTMLSETTSWVHADEEKIGWVLMQLIDNAIKFTPAGGHVNIITQVENGLVSISIEDDGIGIPEHRISEIFQPFHQLDGSMTRRYAGTGLGLTMVNRILNAHGLPIKVQSTVGKGTQFSFSLPLVNHYDD